MHAARTLGNQATLMNIERRRVLSALAGAPSLPLPWKASAHPGIDKGPFDGSVEALPSNEIPEWFREAKFGCPSRFGHKDIGRMWNAGKVDPGHLTSLNHAIPLRIARAEVRDAGTY